MTNVHVKEAGNDRKEKVQKEHHHILEESAHIINARSKKSKR